MSTVPHIPLIMRKGSPPSEAVGKPLKIGSQHVRIDQDGLLIERNIPVSLTSGVTMFIDLYRSAGAPAERKLPALLGWSPYGKHNTSDRLWPEAGIEAGWISKYTAFEAPDPMHWCRHGYAVVYADPPGSWLSEGTLHHGGHLESRDCYDLVEWLGVQEWCNGKIGMTGVSYLACIQYQVASLKPPHLAAINPWEGFSDWYREFGYHGGIPETRFIPKASANLHWSTTEVEDTEANMQQHPLYDSYWESKEVDLEAINTPAFVVASWADQGLHTRGTLEAYKRISSPQKWLQVHGQKKWANYYHPESVKLQRQFFDHFLKDSDDAVTHWPQVRIEVRERANVALRRNEAEWPLLRTQFRKLFLDASKGTLGPETGAASSSLRYDPLAADGRASFDYTFKNDTELTGHMKLRLWAEAEGSDDMDIFVAIQKLDSSGTLVPFTFYALYEDGPVALGWLRASHRSLDPARSMPEQPVHSHLREELLEHGVPVALEIEIWPSSTLFRADETLRLTVMGRDIYANAVPGLPYCLHQDTRNKGTHILHTGGAYDSHLLIPVIAT